MRCPECGQSELIRSVRDLPYQYKGKTTTFREVKGDFCSACGESVLDASESSRVMNEMNAFSEQANADMFNPHFPEDWGKIPG